MKYTNVILCSAAIIIIGASLYYVVEDRGALFSKQSSISTKEVSQSNVIRPVSTIRHGHGLGVDVTDPNRVYIATHEGLLMLSTDNQLYSIGDSQDDLMGFSMHPTNPKIFFSSGHPHRGGGNLGFQRSDDGGLTWQKVSPGSNGPVDFHAMAVSPVNPNLMYGWYYNSLQRSRDGGTTWEVVSTALTQVISLVADVMDEKKLYATTTNGIQASIDEGATWKPLTTETLGAVSALAINPQESQSMLLFSQHHGLSQSTDGGLTWRKLAESFGTSPVMFIAYSKTDPQKVYALTHSNALYGSSDGGITWSNTKEAQ